MNAFYFFGKSHFLKDVNEILQITPLVFGMLEWIRDVPDGFPEAVENISGR
jgi:hypothetical protein